MKATLFLRPKNRKSAAPIISTLVTESQKMVPNHTFSFHYIYYNNMKSITFSV